MPVGLGWNAGAVRARLLARRRVGVEGCRALARSPSLAEALESLKRGPYSRDLRPERGLAEAQWTVAATPLWHLRILAGWLPPTGAELVRVLGGWWELLNIEGFLAERLGGADMPAYDLGRLDTAWNRIRDVSSVEELQAALKASRWPIPKEADPASMVVALRLAWAQRVVDEEEGARRLLAGWAALVVAREVTETGGTSSPRMAGAIRLLGRSWSEAKNLEELRNRLPRDAAWVLREIEAPEDVWRAEIRWWRALGQSGGELLRRPQSGRAAVLGAFGVLLSDAHRVQGALELAARGGGSQEDIDELL